MHVNIRIIYINNPFKFFDMILATYFKSVESVRALFKASRSPIWRRIYIASISDRLSFNTNFSRSLCISVLSVVSSRLR